MFHVHHDSSDLTSEQRVDAQICRELGLSEDDSSGALGRGPRRLGVEAAGAAVGVRALAKPCGLVTVGSLPGKIEDRGNEGGGDVDARVAGGGGWTAALPAEEEEESGKTQGRERPRGDLYIDMDDDCDGHVEPGGRGAEDSAGADSGSGGGLGLLPPPPLRQAGTGSGSAAGCELAAVGGVEGERAAARNGGLLLMDEDGYAGAGSRVAEADRCGDGVLVRDQSRRDSETSVAGDLDSWYAGDG